MFPVFCERSHLFQTWRHTLTNSAFKLWRADDFEVVKVQLFNDYFVISKADGWWPYLRCLQVHGDIGNISSHELKNFSDKIFPWIFPFWGGVKRVNIKNILEIIKTSNFKVIKEELSESIIWNIHLCHPLALICRDNELLDMWVQRYEFKDVSSKIKPANPIFSPQGITSTRPVALKVSSMSQRCF